MLLSWLLERGWVLLYKSCLLLHEKAGIEFGLTDMSDCAVTYEGAESKNISDNSLVMRLPEHKSSEFSNSSDYHHDVVLLINIGTCRFLTSICLKLLSDPSRDLILSNELVLNHLLSVIVQIETNSSLI